MKDVDYTLTRKDASKLLKVSVRTVDRYIKSGQLSALQEDRNVLLSKDEVKDFKKRKGKIRPSPKGKKEVCPVDKKVMSSRQKGVYSDEVSAAVRQDRVDIVIPGEDLEEEQSTHKKIFFEQVAGLELKEKIEKTLAQKFKECPLDTKKGEREKLCPVDSKMSTGLGVSEKEKVEIEGLS
ncbi:helix-turn-helix domain-containing protein, partial [Candidatus Peregrinibacteria bacterium]|nr:helix-turn-helix domain-containing protein [Candidatus Peregrinibacteria bacterium]